MELLRAEMLRINKLLFFAGLGLLWLGYNLLKTEYLFVYGQPVAPIAGYVSIAVGILFIVVALLHKGPVVKEEFLICPKCEKSYRKSNVPDMQCPVCKVGLETLKDYYDHKDEKEKDGSGQS